LSLVTILEPLDIFFDVLSNPLLKVRQKTIHRSFPGVAGDIKADRCMHFITVEQSRFRPGPDGVIVVFGHQPDDVSFPFGKITAKLVLNGMVVIRSRLYFVVTGLDINTVDPNGQEFFTRRSHKPIFSLLVGLNRVARLVVYFALSSANYWIYYRNNNPDYAYH
jgi:hypothetical protein